MRVADLLVGISIRRASTFERYPSRPVTVVYPQRIQLLANRDDPANGDVAFLSPASAGSQFLPSNA